MLHVENNIDIHVWLELELLILINVKQELSYRKQIARQLRKQFVEGISVTLKSTLRAIQEAVVARFATS